MARPLSNDYAAWYAGYVNRTKGETPIELIQQYTDAINIFIENLPEEIKKKMDMSSVTMESVSFIDKDLSSRVSDVLFKARFGKEELDDLAHQLESSL